MKKNRVLVLSLAVGASVLIAGCGEPVASAPSFTSSFTGPTEGPMTAPFVATEAPTPSPTSSPTPVPDTICRTAIEPDPSGGRPDIGKWVIVLQQHFANNDGGPLGGCTAPHAAALAEGFAYQDLDAIPAGMTAVCNGSNGLTIYATSARLSRQMAQHACNASNS